MTVVGTAETFLKKQYTLCSVVAHIPEAVVRGSSVVVLILSGLMFFSRMATPSLAVPGSPYAMSVYRAKFK